MSVCTHCGHEHAYKLSTQLTYDFSLICTRHFWFESHKKAKIMQNRREKKQQLTSVVTALLVTEVYMNSNLNVKPCLCGDKSWYSL